MFKDNIRAAMIAYLQGTWKASFYITAYCKVGLSVNVFNMVAIILPEKNALMDDIANANYQDLAKYNLHITYIQ